MAVLRTVAFLPIPHSHSVIPTVEIQPARPVMEHRVVSAYAYACARVCVSVCLSVCVCVSVSVSVCVSVSVPVPVPVFVSLCLSLQLSLRVSHITYRPEQVLLGFPAVQVCCLRHLSCLSRSPTEP